jgi:integrase
VFIWPDGRPLHPERFSKWFEQHARAAGLPKIRLHDVRHTCHCRAGGRDLAKIVSERHGHANIAITMDTYSRRGEVKGEAPGRRWGDRGDSNPRPSGPQPDALTN